MSQPTSTAPCPAPDRRQRPARPSRPESDGFEVLDEAHRAAQRMLGLFAELVRRLDAEGQDAEARTLARQVLEYFDGPGSRHHADEEQLVFPELVALDDAELSAHVRRLQNDHGWIDADWTELAPHVRAVAEGSNAYDMPFLQAALPVFEALLLDHMALEERVVYPAARRARAAAAERARVRRAAHA